ncbi:uncharacterized protein V6R79_002204 [Siganus canaliculatus]
MAEVLQEKSHGLKFAEQQLLRHGWEHGKGLGRAENGISEAIKVKVKSDKGGVGHKEGEQFTFHWWDHVFNKASSSLQVETDQNGVQVKKMVEEDEEDGMVTNKKPRKAALAKAKLYGCFVKSATLLSGQEQPEPKSASSDDSSSSDEEEEDQKLDLSSVNKLSDADLMKACGGRTAHKGARHGLTMSAKLARLEQQEAEFMAKYGKKSQPATTSSVPVAPALPTHQSADQGDDEKDEDSKRKKKKKKRSSENCTGINGENVPESLETNVKPKKKKKKSSDEPEQVPDAVSNERDVICEEICEVDDSQKTKKKHKKKKNSVERNEEPEFSPEAKSLEETAEMPSEIKVKKKKKKKSSSNDRCEDESDSRESGQSEQVQDFDRKNSKKKPADITEEEETAKQKRKKHKRDKPSVEEDVVEETLPPKKKKKKKSKE